MPLVPAVLVVWATSATCILLLPLIRASRYEVPLSEKQGGGDLLYMQCSFINENSTSGQIIHPIALV